jgi:site-specific DNA-cytosine methylase
MIKQLDILVACEESQEVTKAFRRLGHNAFSCDLQPCSGGHPEWHIQGDVIAQLGNGWDLMIGHPPCTYLSYAGTAHWNNPGRLQKRLKALEFFAALWEAPINHICLENPKGCASPAITKYSQEIQPYYFGDQHLKTTWLWLKNLPALTYSLTGNLFEQQTATERPEAIYTDYTGKKRYFTDAIGGYHGEGNSTLKRSKTFPGIAEAMATQWTEYILNHQLKLAI